MDHIAFTLKKDPLDVRSVNYAAIGDSYITSGNITDENKIPIMMQKILADSNYRERRRTVDEFNSVNFYPVLKFVISFYVQYASLLTDTSIRHHRNFLKSSHA